jgi:DNA-binding NarL/FixJ family response regulator
LAAIRVLLVDDQVLVREGFRQILEAHPGIEVVGEAGDGAEAVQFAERLSPDVVVMEIWLPRLSGIAATEEIRKSCRATRVLILSIHHELHFVEEAVRAGAAGYLVKNESSKTLIEAVQAVHDGRRYLSPEAAAGLMERVMDPGAMKCNSLACLTRREREILQRLAEGSTAKEVAGDLGISMRTAESHRANLMRKLGVH